MQRIISRSGSLQKKLISRCSKGHRYEMVLYNEKPQTSTSLIVRFDEGEGKKEFHIKEVKTIRNGCSRVCLSEANYIVLNPNSRPINVPVVYERIDNVEVPVIAVVDFLKWFAKTEDSGSKDPIQPGARIGRLDAANEAGFFHRTDRSRLKEIKKNLKDKPERAPTEPKKTG